MFEEFNNFIVQTDNADSNPNNPVNQKEKIEYLKKLLESNDKNEEKTREIINIVILNSKDRLYTNDQEAFDYSIDIMANSLTAGGISQSNNIMRNLKNISSISIDSISLRNTYLNVDEVHHLRDSNTGIITSETAGSGSNSKNLRLPMISDLPYLIVKIDDIDQTIVGSNNVINSATCMMIICSTFLHTSSNSGEYSTDGSDNFVEFGNNGRNLIAGRDRSIIYLKNSTEWKKMYFPNTRALLGSIGVSFFTPQGAKLKFLNDYLTVHAIEQVQISGASRNTIRITSSEFFSPEEYMIGDKVKFKDVVIRGNVTFTPALSNNSNKWQVSKTHIVSETNYTSGTGKEKNLILKLVTDGNGDFDTTNSKVLSFGPNLSSGNTVTLTDPGNTSNTAKITIDSIAADSNLQTGALQDFINRTEGHTIINLNNGHDNSGTSSTGFLVNQFDIPFPYNVNKVLGTTSQESTFGMSSSKYFLTSGTLIDLDLQNTITFKITTKKKDDSILEAKLI